MEQTTQQSVIITFTNHRPFGIHQLACHIESDSTNKDGTRFIDVTLSDFQEQSMKQIEGETNAFLKSLSKEFERYKQDCRKRALDLAATELQNWYTQNTRSSVAVNEPRPDVEKNADKYYKWLISIPES